jgi:putative DNA primase/helicase
MSTERVYAVAFAPKRQSPHWTNDTCTWADFTRWVTHPKVTNDKETGNYITAELATTTKVHKPGQPPCTNVHRDNQSVTKRSALLVLDADSPDEGFEVIVEAALRPYRYLWHSTWSHTPEAPRYRIIVAVDRDMTGVEYCDRGPGRTPWH